jgi:hypothetical protein
VDRGNFLYVKSCEPYKGNSHKVSFKREEHNDTFSFSATNPDGNREHVGAITSVFGRRPASNIGRHSVYPDRISVFLFSSLEKERAGLAIITRSLHSKSLTIRPSPDVAPSMLRDLR